jgi:lipid A ethanolaminephosphotransferase
MTALPKRCLAGHGPLVSQTTFALAVSLWLLAVDNAAFWRGAWAALQSGPLRSAAATAALAIVLWLSFGLLLRLVLWPWTARPLASALLLSAALAAHFIEAYGIVIDRGMIRNVFQTDWQEARDLLSPALLWGLVWRGLLPVALVWWVRIERPGCRGSGAALARQAGVTAVLVTAALGAFFADYASLARNHRELRYVLTPTNIVNGVTGVWKKRAATPRALVKVAEDAARPLAGSGVRKPLLVVLAVGETARAASFSLGGYERPTNAALAGKGAVYFGNTTACGTDTATSLPCLFSDVGAARFSVRSAFSRENVLDVLARTGVAVRWLENNSGCKGVCDAVETRIIGDPAGTGVCGGGECLDMVLIEGLRQALAENTPERLLVLHMKGSHGPAYYKRVPAAARRYTPTCDAQIQLCDVQALRNTYDNTIVYSSEVLAQMIDNLAARSDSVDSVFIYVSDHGESLGESGLFLHGMPRWMAPREQTHIPLLVWLSEGAGDRLRVSHHALQAVASEPYSHDNMFHTLLGAFEVRTSAYRRELDLLDRARTGGGSVPAGVAR